MARVYLRDRKSGDKELQVGMRDGSVHRFRGSAKDATEMRTRLLRLCPEIEASTLEEKALASEHREQKSAKARQKTF